MSEPPKFESTGTTTVETTSSPRSWTSEVFDTFYRPIEGMNSAQASIQYVDPKQRWAEHLNAYEDPEKTDRGTESSTNTAATTEKSGMAVSQVEHHSHAN
ncbi:uncharacterized protein L201_000097 [Kwoniella dendrophila CBS 6074]|uniref:Uncharacterized protein n=1 Tax=Kwoniella dendrophila CBS 6074 TaxID=1295534 RepID=A0AAX4JJR8_9TREE